MGIRPAPEDFGQTLGAWGVNGGPYLVLPVLGPSTLRDGIGSGVALYADPVRVAIDDADINVWYKRGYLALYIVDARSQLIESGGDAFLESSLDPYAAARSAYLQLRTAAIANQDDIASGAANGVPAPAGNAATAPATAAPLPGDDQPAASGAPLPQSAAPLPGDDTTPQPVAPPSAAPLPGDDAGAKPAPAQPSPPLPQSAAPLPGDDQPATPPK
jgi:phospholipid-binding lipoprotein MlaA